MAAGLRLVPIALAVLLAGCESSIYRTDYLDGGKSVVTDAKQRIVTNTKGNVSWGRNRPKRILCAEPSPDVAEALSKAISASFAGAAQGQGNVNAEVSASMSAGIVQLGERLATVQLLRDGLYRACEAYSNGAISDATYALIVSRVDQTMVALLGMEMAAGAFGRDLAAVSGSAGATTGTDGADPAELQKLRDEERKLVAVEAGEESNERSNGNLAQLRQDQLNGATPEEAATLKAERDKALEAELVAKSKKDAAQAELVAVRAQIAELGAVSTFTSSTARAGGGAVGSGGLANAYYVAQIQETFTNQDKLGPLLASCVTALDSSSVYKAHIHRGQEEDLPRNANDEFLPTGPRTTPLSDLCYQLMKPAGPGGSSVLTEMFKERNAHAENLAMVKATTEIFEVYYRECGKPSAATSAACDRMSDVLAQRVMSGRRL